ncbi:hypothetical protein [Pedobacter sp. NJ-S-72]
MDDQNTSDYNKAIRTRLLRIMEVAGLERTGLAEFTKISDSHLYALLNGTRNITGEIADKIGAGFKLHGGHKSSISTSKSLLKSENLPHYLNFMNCIQAIRNFLLRLKLQ